MTFETRVRKFLGTKRFKKLNPTDKETIKKLSSFQNKTKRIYDNGSLKVYEELGIL